MNAPAEILINGRFLSRKLTGVDRFARELLTALDARLERDPALAARLAFTLLVPRNAETPAFRHIRLRTCGRFTGTLWEQVELPLAARGKRLLSLCNAAPVFKRRQIVVIHDAAPLRVPDSYSRKFRLWYGALMPWLGRISERIITVSNFSASEIPLAYGIPAGKIRVVPESGEHIRRVATEPAILERHGLTARPYVLGVSSLSPHKGFETLIRAVELLGDDAGFDLAIAGGTNPRIFASGDLPAFVKHLGYVSDGELRALYENAACFVFPSYYEGFGLPAAEAMALGCPVIAARAASIPEACSDAARYFTPRNAEELARCLKEAMSSRQWRDEARQKGIGLSHSMRWDDTASGLITILDELDTKGDGLARVPTDRHTDDPQESTDLLRKKAVTQT